MKYNLEIGQSKVTSKNTIRLKKHISKPKVSIFSQKTIAEGKNN